MYLFSGYTESSLLKKKKKKIKVGGTMPEVGKSKNFLSDNIQSLIYS